MLFSLPYIDQPQDFWRSLAADYEASVWEIYFPFPNQTLPTGRPVQPGRHLLSFLETSGLPKAVLLNPILFSQPVDELKDFVLNELYLLNKRYGVRKATVSDLMLCGHIKRELPYYEVSGSTLMRVHHVEQLNYLENRVDAMTWDTSVVRDLNRLATLRQSFPQKIKLLVNEGCIPGCPFRIQHFYEMSRDEGFPQSLCLGLLQENPWLRLRNAWILPQHLHFYEGLYDIVKLSGRVTLQSPGKYRRVLDAYLNCRELGPHEIGCGPGGLGENLPITAEFFHKTITCEKHCSQCSTCRVYYDEHAKR